MSYALRLHLEQVDPVAMASSIMADRDPPCTDACYRVLAPHATRGEPLCFTLGPDGAPLDAVLWVDGAAHPITKAVTIIGRGRDVADVLLVHDTISRRAAVLRICPHGARLEDHGSGTSVLINSERVSAEGTRIFERDEIGLGHLRARLARRVPSRSTIA